MIERIEGMPAGILGLKASGTLTRDDYRDVLEPALEEAVEAGGIRLVFVLSDFGGLGHGAWVEDAKTGLRAWVGDHASWKRFGLVTDEEWVAKAMHLFAWMAPGEVRTFELGELDEAKSWAAG
ncbi:MAG TPA: STAS/SEC14 domain-containing protein [Solirubrobacterales bacterium]|nr:STAS/SEC14 domain-containing protein [Solirubrobacterales bacterium]